jgi:hypothetical protein
LATLDLRFRFASPGLWTLPWREPLSSWDVTTVDLRDIPVGPSRHLVRFVHADDRLWALKAMPCRTARKEYDVLRELEHRSLSAVRAAGIVTQPLDDSAVLVTPYLEGSWQYRRLLMRVPFSMTAHRARLFDAMAALLVDLHRNGIYWGDCSLANTLFKRDGQRFEAWLVDAETAEFHPALTDGQRQLDLDIMVENVTGGLLVVAARREEPESTFARIYEEGLGVADRYESLWRLLHDEPVIALHDQPRIDERLRSLNEAGFEIDEVQLEPAAPTELAAAVAASPGEDRGSVNDRLRMKVAVATRTFHAAQLRSLTGIEASEGQASILLNDLRAHQAHRQAEMGQDVPERVAARHWLLDVFTPGVERSHRALHGHGDPIQAYCDLIEVRWLLSEQAGHDVGDGPALEALAQRVTPGESAANLSFVDLATEELPALTPDVIDQYENPV